MSDIQPAPRRPPGPGSARLSACHLTADLPEEAGLQLRDALPGVQNQRLVFLELRREEALAADQRLLADVVRGHLRQVGVGDLDVVAEDPVVADLERLYARPLPFLGFQVGQVLPCVVGRRAQVVQFLRESLPDDIAFARPGRGFVDDCPGNQFDSSGTFTQARASASRRAALPQCFNQRRHYFQAAPQGHHLAGQWQYRSRPG